MISISGFGIWQGGLGSYDHPTLLPILSILLCSFGISPPSLRTSALTDSKKETLFKSDELSECSQNASEEVHAPEVNLKLLGLSAKGHKCLSVQSSFALTEGQSVTFVLRTSPDEMQAVILEQQDDKKKGNFKRV